MTISQYEIDIANYEPPDYQWCADCGRYKVFRAGSPREWFYSAPRYCMACRPPVHYPMSFQLGGDAFANMQEDNDFANRFVNVSDGS